MPPEDLTVLLDLTVAGAAVARNMRVKVRPGWTEPLNLFTVTALPPGSRKSAVFQKVVKPLEDGERKLRNSKNDDVKARNDLQILEKQYEHAVKLAARALRLQMG